MSKSSIVPYPKEVEIARKWICGTDKYRRLILFKFINKDRQRKGRIVVVCMNPSKANKECSDQTVNQLIRYAYRHNYESLTVLNIYSLYETNSQKLPKDKDFESNSDLREEYSRNIDFVTSIISNFKGTLLIAFGRAFRNYLYEAQIKVIDAAKDAIYKNSITLKKVKGFDYYHHPARVVFELEELTLDQLEESKDLLRRNKSECKK